MGRNDGDLLAIATWPVTENKGLAGPDRPHIHTTPRPLEEKDEGQATQAACKRPLNKTWSGTKNSQLVKGQV